MLKLRRIIIGAGAVGLILSGAAQAEFEGTGYYNFVDTETGLEWRRALPINNAQEGYDITFSQYDADTTYRYPAAAEVDDLLTKLFPNFVANDASGRCAEILNNTGGYPELLDEAQAFLALFGDTSPDAGAIEALYEDASGTLRALWVHLIPWQSNGDVATVCLTGRYVDYEGHRSAPLPGSQTVTFVVRAELDRKAPSITLFQELDPREVGFTPLTLLWGQPNPYYENLGVDDGASDSNWQTYLTFPDYTGQSYFTEFELAVSLDEYGAGRLAPWVRVNSMEYTGPCVSGDADIGNGWCRRTFAGAQYEFSGESIDLSATYVDNQGNVDNIQVDQIWENISVDYYPPDTSNTIRPKQIGWSIYIEIETTSIAAGDTYDFDAATVDPTSLRAGSGLAQATQYYTNDTDNDGDIDYIFEFRTGDTGVGCLDTHMMLAGRTISGNPIAGMDVINPIGCEETVDIDVDPFNAINTIRPDDDYNITVALLGMRAADGDAIDLYPERERAPNEAYSADGVDRMTLRLGPAETPVIGTPIVIDIDSDSHDDLLLNFNVFDAGIACSDTELELVGSKNSGIPIEGADTIVTEECTTGQCHP